MVVTDPLTRLRDRAIIDFVNVHRLPSLFEFDSFVKRGGLISYGPSIAEMAPRVAYFVDRILKGARPGDLPLEGPTRYFLVVNLTTAKALGIEMPPSLLARAEEVIE
jgi:putative ABC transport system substrate-binding protein